jgi:hypothetical protein
VHLCASTSGLGDKLLKRLSIAALIDADLVLRRVRVKARDVVFLKGIFEASEGLGAMFAERGGELVLAAPLSRARDLDELLEDLRMEIGASIEIMDEAATG